MPDMSAAAGSQRTAQARRDPRTSAEATTGRTLRRRRSSRVIAGVAGGLADHLRVDVRWVRVIITLLAAVDGLGVVVYGALWAVVRQRSVDVAEPDSPRERTQAIGMVVLGFGLLVATSSFGQGLSGQLFFPASVALIGAVLVWREADETQRRRWAQGARTGVAEVFIGNGGRGAIIRSLSGAALVITGIVVLLVDSLALAPLQFALLSVIVTLIGTAVLTLPWWLRLVRDLDEERFARIRTEERAEIAAHLHDSVLQTLALIQKQAENDKEVRRLARSQERQLRTWLYGATGYGGSSRAGGADADTDAPPAEPTSAKTLAEVVSEVCGEVEDTFAIKVQQVVVGDCEVDDRVLAAVWAAREAMVNAAKHAEVGEVSVFVEIEPEQIELFVRDRGKGFDPTTVSQDRHGLADSIHGRMERHGGTVRLRTAPGEGTEVALRLPRTGDKR
ncbi:phage shock protein C (PspC) family protein [Actinoalloteichus hymeniacidonis]|uniref:Phage shock protein C (PspC) family protein n=2 Tax=Actinoalloteichus hymeniacidonis TaxID=340345 RepID=A0AAC9HU97_9PSEU|nr:phage shock protein C (PspC) family protein [Actinoalloteichus hymeniacidonis]